MNNPYFLWYDNPLLAVMAFGLFFLLRTAFAKGGWSRGVVEMSKMTYGIYLSHFMLVYLVSEMVKTNRWNFIWFYLVWLAVVILDIGFLCGVKYFLKKASRVLFRY